MAGHFHEPHVVCPKCSHQIPLTESLAAPLLEAERRRFQEQLSEREIEFSRRTDELQKQQSILAKAKEGLEEQIKQRVEVERQQLIAVESRKARELVADDLNAIRQQLAE